MMTAYRLMVHLIIWSNEFMFSPQAYLHNEVPFKPDEFIDTMKNHKIEPTIITYQRCIERYCELGNMNEARKLFKISGLDKLPATERMSHAFIRGYIRSGDEDSARAIIESMTSKGKNITGDALAVIACALVEMNDTNKIFEIIEGHCLSVNQYLKIAKALALSGDVESVRKIVAKIPLANHCSAALFNACAQLIALNKHEVALIVCERILPNHTRRDVGCLSIKRMVETGLETNEVAKFCRQLEAQKIMEGGLSYAFEMALVLPSPATAINYLRLSNEERIPISPGDFFSVLSKATTESDVIETIQIMKSVKGTLSKNGYSAGSESSSLECSADISLEQRNSLPNVETVEFPSIENSIQQANSRTETGRMNRKAEPKPIFQLINEYFQSNMAEHSELLLSQLYSTVMMKLTVDKGDVEGAWNFYEKATNKKEFCLDDDMFFAFAFLLARNGCIRHLRKVFKNHKFDRTSRANHKRAVDLLNIIVEWVSPTESLQIAQNYISQIATMNDDIYEPVMRVALEKEDIGLCFALYKDLARYKRVTPLRRELSLRVLNQNNTEYIQELIKLSYDLHGHLNTVIHLASYYCELGRLDEARQQLSGFDLRRDHRQVAQLCNQMIKERLVTQLEAFAPLLEEAGYNKNKLCLFRIEAHLVNKNVEKALDLWRMNHTNELFLSEKLIHGLCEQLISEGRDIPSDLQAEVNSLKMRLSETAANTRKTDNTRGFDTMQLNEKYLTFHQYTTRLEKLIRDGNLLDAISTLKEVLQEHSAAPGMMTMDLLLSEMAQNGMTEEMSSLRPLMNEELLHLYHFDEHLCSGHISAGRLSDCLAILDHLPATTPFNGDWPDELLVKHPEMNDAILRNAKRFVLEANNYSLLNGYWTHLFLNRNFSHAEIIAKEFPQLFGQKFHVNRILNRIRETTDEIMAEYLLTFMKNVKLEGLYATVLNVYLSVLIQKQRVNDAHTKFKEAHLEGLEINQCNVSVLQKLENELDLLGSKLCCRLPIKELES